MNFCQKILQEFLNSEVRPGLELVRRSTWFAKRINHRSACMYDEWIVAIKVTFHKAHFRGCWHAHHLSSMFKAALYIFHFNCKKFAP